MPSRRYRVICFVARHCGVELLNRLIQHPQIDVVCVFTHSKRPKSEDPARSERPEFASMRHMTSLRNIPLYVVDSPKDEIFENVESLGEFDFLLSLSWRFLVPQQILSRARLASINLHRGLLPQYAGAEPVRRMLEDGLKQATITAHVMEEMIDSGEILFEAHLPMEILDRETLPQAVSRIKCELDPVYPAVALNAIQKVLKSKGLPKLEGA